MVYVVTPSAVLRPGALAGRRAPRPLLPAGLALAPRTRPLGREARRLLFQHALARYVAALLPFPIAMIIWPELALPISQAPLLMLILVLFIETSVLSIGSPEKRRALAPRDEIARVGDLLRTRARDRSPHRRRPRPRLRNPPPRRRTVGDGARPALQPRLAAIRDGRGPRHRRRGAGPPRRLAVRRRPDRAAPARRQPRHRHLHAATSLDTRTVSAHARLAAMAAR
jgi:hypothetical protein